MVEQRETLPTAQPPPAPKGTVLSFAAPGGLLEFDLSWLSNSSLGDSSLQPLSLLPQVWLILGAQEASGRVRQTAEEVERAAEILGEAGFPAGI